MTITLPPIGEPQPLPTRPEGQRERQIELLRAEIAKLDSGAGMLPAWAREHRLAGYREELSWLLHDASMSEQAANAFADEE